jgi:hypothetical protein
MKMMAKAFALVAAKPCRAVVAVASSSFVAAELVDDGKGHGTTFVGTCVEVQQQQQSHLLLPTAQCSWREDVQLDVGGDGTTQQQHVVVMKYQTQLVAVLLVGILGQSLSWFCVDVITVRTREVV